LGIRIEGPNFKDPYGRTLMLRGVNLGGSSKVPSRPDGATHKPEGFFNHREVSFVGRPFPLDEADEHYRRLRAWGLTLLRFVITWEAIEHAGPGKYDQEYLDYLHNVVARAAKYGLTVFIDMHQDMWSRFSGGDGAPGWTLEAAGFDLAGFKDTGAAIVHQTHGDPLPKMIWGTNGSKLAAASMFTFFFGGIDFAPLLQVEGESIQKYLQRRYIEAMLQVVHRLKDLPNVIGYDIMNEPLTGYIGWQDLNSNGGELNLGESPTPYQAMLLGDGVPQKVANWKLGLFDLYRAGTHLLNPNRRRAWQENRKCVWRQHGVWDYDSSGRPWLLRPDYFCQVKGQEVDFNRDYLVPFAKRCATEIRAADPHALIFIESATSGIAPHWMVRDATHFVYAPHWYDGYVLVKQAYSRFIAVDYLTHKVVLGPRKIRRSFYRQLALIALAALEDFGGIPTLIGEFGIPFNLNNGRSYRTGDFRAQVKALDRSFQALEANLLNGTLWNYTPDNTNARGDLWNGEDFSIFSRDQQQNPQDINSGGRALQAVVRPYPRATAGEPLRMSFNLSSHRFEFEFIHDPRVTAPTEIFLPSLQYPRGCSVEVSDGRYETNPDEQVLVYHHDPAVSEHRIVISA